MAPFAFSCLAGWVAIAAGHGSPSKIVVVGSTPAISQASARFRPSSRRSSGVSVIGSRKP